MTGVQKFFKAILPKRVGEEMEAESRAWKVKCECGRSRSIWDLGGIRWKAAGNPRRKMLCPECGQIAWHTLVKES